MNKKLLSLICFLAILTASCKKDGTVSETEPDSTIADLVVPKTFQWHTVAHVNLSVGISDKRFQNKLHIIAVYLTDPAIPTGKVDGADQFPKAIAKGSASLVSPYNTSFDVPETVTEAFIVKIAPDGTSFTQMVKLNAATISISLGTSATNDFKLPGALSATIPNAKLTSVIRTTSTFNTEPTLTDVEPGCGITSTNSRSTLSLVYSGSSVLCFNSSTDVALGISATAGGTVKLNAPGKIITISAINHSSLDLYITAGTTVIFPASYTIASSEKLVNNGTLRTTGTSTNLIVNGTFINNGTTSLSADLNEGSGAVIVNTSVMSMQDAVVNGAVSNNKSFSASTLTASSGAIFDNLCYTNISGAVTVNAYSYVKNSSLMVAKNTFINSNAAIYETDGAMYQTDVFTLNAGYVYGTGDVSLFKVVTSVSDAVVSNSGFFLGNIQYCGSKNIDASRSHFSFGAVQACGLYIPKDECNTLGNGTAPAPIKPDTDGDGVIDEQDDYPNDKTKAFDNTSVNYQNGGSTVAFEDSWPSQGDYDLNDVVLTYKHLVVTNAANFVVHVEGQWNLLATGGDYQNGAGIQFPLPKGNITNFSASNGLPVEIGQDSLVVTLFTNSRALQTTWNTINGQSVSPSKSFTFSFDVTNGPTIATMGVSSYNPFIWNNSTGFGRGYETHLFGENPTKLAMVSLFGTKADNSKLGPFYGTLSRLPWGIEIPVVDFKYPLEYKPISVAYLKFNNWATSGGTADKDWYSNTGAAYRNTGNLYSGK
jgi:LruC domain-containing protein